MDSVCNATGAYAGCTRLFLSSIENFSHEDILKAIEKVVRIEKEIGWRRPAEGMEPL